MTNEELLKLIPIISEVEMAFPAGRTIENAYEDLTSIALDWKDDNRQNWAIPFFSKLFFSGATVPEYKTGDVSTPDNIKAARFMYAASKSFYPKHEHKEAVCAMLWDAFFVDPDL